MSAAIDFESALRGQIDAITQSLQREFSDPSMGPVIAHVDYAIDQNWSGDDAIHFTVTLRTTPGDGRDALTLADQMRSTALALVRQHGIARIPYVAFRLENERPAVP